MTSVLSVRRLANPLLVAATVSALALGVGVPSGTAQASGTAIYPVTEVVLAFDTSDSFQAVDPTGRLKPELETFVNLLDPSVRLQILNYDGVRLLPFSTDRAAARAALSRLDDSDPTSDIVCNEGSADYPVIRVGVWCLARLAFNSFDVDVPMTRKVVFITDGSTANEPVVSYRIPVTQTEHSGIDTATIGLGSSPERETWDYLAQQATGVRDHTYQAVPTMGGLAAALARIRFATDLPSTYVALGDSFQSGEGAYEYNAGTDTDANRCHRSRNAYPYLLVQRNVVSLDLDFRACSGAVIGNMSGFGPDFTGAQYDEQPQLEALNSDTALVTIGIGGNDLGFASTITTCATQSVVLIPCQAAMGDAVAASIESLRTGDVRDQLLRLYAQVRERAPYARVVVISYPMFFSPDRAEFFPVSCGAIAWADAQWINSTIRDANQAFGRLARSMAFDHVDMGDVLSGHEQCTDEPGINGIVVDIGDRRVMAESFHPNELGHDLMASRIQEALAAVPNGLTATIHQGQTITRQATVSGAAFHVNVSWPGSDVHTTLISPSGVQYSRDQVGDFEHSNGPTHERFSIPNPESGEWTIEMFGADIEPGGEPVTLNTYDEPVPNQNPQAQIAVETEGSQFWFDASSSVDGDGQIVSYEWDFGDGNYATGTRVSHTFEPGGPYYVMLKVTDDAGASGFATIEDPIEPQPVEEPGGHYFASSITLTNSMVLVGDTTVAGNFTCNSNGRVDGNLTVTGNVTLTNACRVSGDLHAGGSIDMTSAASIGGAVATAGDVLFQSTARIEGPVTAAGNFASRDGVTIPALQQAGSLGSTVDHHVAVAAPVSQPPSEPAVDVSAAITWQQWVNRIAMSNNAPSWSPGLTSNPGCTIAPWSSSVNGSSVLVDESLVVDARSSTSNCSTAGLQQMTIAISGDLTILANNLQSINGLTVTSADGLPHALNIVMPGALGGPGSASFSAGTVVDDLIATSIWAPGSVTIGSDSSMVGTIASESIAGWGNVRVGMR